jgi:diguanylate cyclase (GGDEF)-like protein
MLRTRVLAWLTRTIVANSSNPSGKVGHDAIRLRSADRESAADTKDAADVAAAAHADTLAMMPLFRALDRQLILHLVTQATEEVFTAGHIVIHQGEPSASPYVVLSGQVRIVQATCESQFAGQGLAEFGYGEIFGELGTLIEQPRSATVVAVEHTRCLALSPERFMQVIRQSPELAIGVLRMIALRLYNGDRLLARYAPDPLTGLLGRRAFYDHYQRLAAGPRRRRSGVTLLVVDILHLKAINDRFGYMVGDEVLRAVADALKETTRTSDLVARYGGDEFVALLVDSGPVQVELAVTRLYEKIADLAARRGLPREIQCTIGITSSQEPPETADELLWAAGEDLRQKR